MMPPKDTDEWGLPDGADDEAENIFLPSLWQAAYTRRQDPGG